MQYFLFKTILCKIVDTASSVKSETFLGNINIVPASLFITSSVITVQSAKCFSQTTDDFVDVNSQKKRI